MHGVYGFFCCRMFGDPVEHHPVEQLPRDQEIAGISTAIVFPIYNEDIVRVYEGLRATYQSLQKTGQFERFDFLFHFERFHRPGQTGRGGTPLVRPDSANWTRWAGFIIAAA